MRSTRTESRVGQQGNTSATTPSPSCRAQDYRRTRPSSRSIRRAG
ncbi:hypothetical protein E2C01_088634 [Portunus trituberculatus]|uniref:Uncharacterized protein n=1 Tax=Portunus trituberculatus TaxID=210409 RepID=A0A5B7JMF0_PORTR|nr:hypothetical protein [Portunus trituberculatus]